MKFYDMAKTLCLETSASGISLGAGLFQVRDVMNCRHNETPDKTLLCPVAFASKSLSSAKWHYSSIECEGLRILPGLDKFNHCFAREVYVITNHKPLVAILSKDVSTLSEVTYVTFWVTYAVNLENIVPTHCPTTVATYCLQVGQHVLILS